MFPNSPQHQTPGATSRTRGARTQVACTNCKERKLRCDDQIPACANCQRFGIICLIEDPATKRRQPRNYLETLEQRVVFLEGLLRNVIPANPFPTELENDATVQRTQDENDEISDLASKVGMLGLSAGGAEPHYLGSSSAFAFSRLINSSLRKIVTEKQTRIPGFPQDSPSILTPCALPDYATGLTLSNAYFENIHPQYPFLHEPTFRSWEKMFTNPDETLNSSPYNPLPLFFINIVYAIGALLFPQSQDLAQRLYLSAQLYADHVLPLDNLESIQAILCCAMFSLRSPTGPSIWKLTGLALRQCIELGYHRSATRFAILKSNPLRLEMRKRAFWCAYGIDCQVAITLGRPLGIPDQEVDAEFPADIDDSSITENGIYGTPRLSSNDPPTSMSIAIHVLRLRRLWAQIHTNIYSDTTLKHDDPTYTLRIQKLRSELDNWRASVPPILPRIGEVLSLFARRDWFDLNYNYSILLLYRGQLIDSRGVPDDIFFQCLRAAEAICHGYRQQFIGKPLQYTWGALHFLFLAGLTYLHCIWSSPAVRQAARQDDVSSTCTDCTMVLVVMAERWHGAGSYRDIFETLASRTLTMMVEQNNQRSMVPDTSTLSEGLNYGDLSQWRADIADIGMSDGVDMFLTSLTGGIQEDTSAEPNWEDLVSSP